eukprot:1160172-Pelagomonas_calceolata.AAC.1
MGSLLGCFAVYSPSCAAAAGAAGAFISPFNASSYAQPQVQLAVLLPLAGQEGQAGSSLSLLLSHMCNKLSCTDAPGWARGAGWVFPVIAYSYAQPQVLRLLCAEAPGWAMGAGWTCLGGFSCSKASPRTG